MKDNEYKRAKEIKDELAVLDFILGFYKTEDDKQGITIAARDEYIKKPHVAMSLDLPKKWQDKLYEFCLIYKNELEMEFEEL